MTIVVAAIMGLVVAKLYKYTHTGLYYSQSFALTLVLMTVMIAVVLVAIDSNVARAISFASAFCIMRPIRFRTNLREPRDVAFLFLSTGIGLVVGIGAYIYAVAAIVLMGLLLIVMFKGNLFAPDYVNKRLKITIAENMSYEGAFDAVLQKYCKSFVLTRVASVDLGTLFELIYEVQMNPDANEKQFLDELRMLNGNLAIHLLLAPTEKLI